MTGEVKGGRSKKCLSRNKRSKPGKSTLNESDDTASETYTAVRSRTSDEKSGHLEKVTEEFNEVSNSDSVKSVKNKLTGRASKDHKNDVFEFCDDDDLAISNDDDKSRCIEKSHGNKRKWIDSDEIEPSGFQNVVSKFKRSRKALINLKQPTVCLEKCKDVDAESKKEAERKGKATERNKIETSSDQLHKVEFIADNEVPLLGNQKQKQNSDNQQRVDSTFKGNIADHNNMSDDKEDCSQNQVCPVCSLKFSATDQMDVINTHINSCLDGGTGSCNRENVTSSAACEDIGEDLFFCQLCQKDLSRLNSQRRQQHINRCCDQASKTEEMPPLNTAPAPAPVQCPICGKGFKSFKTRQTHLKKCAQEYNIETNQLLEIVQRLRQEEDSSSLAAGTESQVNRASSTNSHPATNTSGVKRKRRNVKPECDLDEQTQIALALSASMAPPPPPASNVGKGGKGKGKKNKGGSELPAMLLRDDETAQRALALRAAQVLCTQEADEEEDEISCTPALAPSRLAQNIPDYQPEMEDEQCADDLDSKVEKTMKSDCKGSEDDAMDVDGGNNSDKDKEGSKESVECTAIVDPLLSRSFLNSLYDDEVEESQPAEIKATGPIRLWSLAATNKDQSSASFYVPGLLPPASPKRSPKPLKQHTPSKLSVTETNVQNESHKQVTDIAVNKEIASHVTSERTGESVAQLQTSTSENDECPEITPTQANVELLLDLAGDDDTTNMSMDSQQMTAASGFWVDDEQEEEEKENDALPSGVAQLLQDLSSMINNSRLSDVVISLKDGQEMAAHSFILSLRSEVLAQLLEEQKALQKDRGSGGRTDQVYLKFEEIDQSAFKVVLKHIYTGDVTIPEDCELDNVTDLAERFKLPCLLNACKKAQSRLKQVTDSQEDDDTDLCIATDVEKLEENLWKNDNDDDEDCQTTKDKEDEFEDDFLDDDDIEEIMIFQTQSLQRKASQSTGSERKDSEELLSPGAGEEISIIENKKVEFGDNLSRKESCFATPEITEQELGERSLSRFPVEENNVSLNCLEKDNLSRSPVDKGCVSRNPTEESNLSRNSHENDENSAEEEEDVELIMSCVKEKIVKEDALIEKEQHPLGDECVEMKHFRKESDDHEAVQLLSRDDNKISHACVRVDEPITDSDDNEAQPDDQVQEISKGHALGGDLEQSCAVDENLAHIEVDELENDANFNVSADLLDGEEERRDGDVTEHVSGEIQDNNEILNDHAESKNEAADKTLPLASEEGRWDDNDEVFQGSPGEVVVPDNVESDDDMEEMVPDESITLISDNEEEALDLYVSPPKTDVTIIPETPRARGRSSTKSSSTFSVSEEDDISVTGSSPSKSRKQLNEEATEFLSKLTQRAKRGKGKRQSKKTSKSNGTKKSPVESSSKQTSPRNNSPRKNMDARVGTSTMPSKTRASKQDSSALSNSPMRMSPKGCKSPSASQMRMSPRGCKSPSDSPVRMTSRDCKSPSNSPMRMSPRGYNSPSDVTLQTSPRSSKSPRGSPMPKSPRGNKSPRGLNPRSLSPVVESDVPVVTIDNSPPVSPGLLQSRDSPHNSQTKRKEGEKMEDLCGRQTLDEKEADFGDPDDVEIVETCADNTEADVYGDLALSTTSSPRDVMSPPVPSPSYSFLEHLSSPGSPSPYASPQKSALSPGPVSPSLPVDWKSPSPERKLGSCPQPNSPVSPSVCSYSSQVARDLCPQDKKKDAVKNLEKKFEENFEEKEKSRNAEVVEIDPNVPLMERLKAKRGGGHKMFSLGKEEDSNSDDCCAKNEVKEDEKESAMASSQPEKVTNTQHEMNEMENISMGDDFDFYDDGGFNFDLEELNNLEGCTGDDNNVKANEDCHSKKEENKDKPVPQKKGRKNKDCHSNEEEDKNKVVPQKRGSNKVAGKRKIPPSQRRVEDSDDDDKPQEAPSKRGKKTDTQSKKAAGQAVTQPVTPMPNYNQMATPVLKVELNKFGVRPLPKKRMILKLKEIYDYTHQVKPATQESQTERAPSKGKPQASNVAVSDAAEKVDGSGTASSDNNSDEDDAEFGDCTVMIEDDVITASQQVNGNNLKERLVYYIQSNEDLYSRILRYQPIELMLLHQQIKSHGINCSLGKLVDFLDQQCITFTTAGSRPRATRKRGRKKKGDNAKPSK